jgi:phage-related protein
MPNPAYILLSGAIAILDIFSKKTRKTPDDVLTQCRRRLAALKEVDRS